mmetsp:Transcript_42485/g.83511  ORF Transcript_42485/g.83511 Transcript_42485/m.83511 type:complete len:259 (+) Transcript_42485:458-1234(+)
MHAPVPSTNGAVEVPHRHQNRRGRRSTGMCRVVCGERSDEVTDARVVDAGAAAAVADVDRREQQGRSGEEAYGRGAPHVDPGGLDGGDDHVGEGRKRKHRYDAGERIALHPVPGRAGAPLARMHPRAAGSAEAGAEVCDDIHRELLQTHDVRRPLLQQLPADEGHHAVAVGRAGVLAKDEVRQQPPRPLLSSLHARHRRGRRQDAVHGALLHVVRRHAQHRPHLPLPVRERDANRLVVRPRQPGTVDRARVSDALLVR